MIFQLYPVAYLTSPLQTELCSRRREIVGKTVTSRGRWHRGKTCVEWAPSEVQIERTSPGRGIGTAIHW